MVLRIEDETMTRERYKKKIKNRNHENISYVVDSLSWKGKFTNTYTYLFSSVGAAISRAHHLEKSRPENHHHPRTSSYAAGT